MRRTFWLGLALVLVSGCGGANTPDAVSKEALASMSELSGVLEGIKDEASGDAAVSKIDKIVEKMNQFKEKMDSFKLSAEDKKKIEDKYKKEGEDIVKKLIGSSIKASQAAPKAMKKISESMSKMKK
jgi:hypothetical protein